MSPLNRHKTINAGIPYVHAPTLFPSILITPSIHIYDHPYMLYDMQSILQTIMTMLKMTFCSLILSKVFV